MLRLQIAVSSCHGSGFPSRWFRLSFSLPPLRSSTRRIFVFRSGLGEAGAVPTAEGASGRFIAACCFAAPVDRDLPASGRLRPLRPRAARGSGGAGTDGLFALNGANLGGPFDLNGLEGHSARCRTRPPRWRRSPRNGPSSRHSCLTSVARWRGRRHAAATPRFRRKPMNPGMTSRDAPAAEESAGQQHA